MNTEEPCHDDRSRCASTGVRGPTWHIGTRLDGLGLPERPSGDCALRTQLPDVRRLIGFQGASFGDLHPSGARRGRGWRRCHALVRMASNLMGHVEAI